LPSSRCRRRFLPSTPKNCKTAKLHKAFDLLKDDIQEQIRTLEKTRTKRQLTAEEQKIIKQLKKNLNDVENFVKKEIEDIDK
jgi:copper homeostasis protein CutC